MRPTPLPPKTQLSHMPVNGVRPANGLRLSCMQFTDPQVTGRELLSIGGLSLLGLSLPEVLHRQAQARENRLASNGFGCARSVILLYLQGSPSHIDLWDPKPNAPDYIRGEFKPIA